MGVKLRGELAMRSTVGKVFRGFAAGGWAAGAGALAPAAGGWRRRAGRRRVWAVGLLALALSCGGHGPRSSRSQAARLPLGRTVGERVAQYLHGGIRAGAQFDFVVGLYARGRLRCAGTLLQSGWVLTAAHCACADTVVPGVDQRRGAAGGIAVARRFAPQGYDSRSPARDIALLKLSAVPNGPWMMRAEDDHWKRAAEPRLNLLRWGGCDSSRGAACRTAVDLVSEGACRSAPAGRPAAPAVPGGTFCTSAVFTRGGAAGGGGGANGAKGAHGSAGAHGRSGSAGGAGGDGGDGGDGGEIESGGPVIAATERGPRLVGVVGRLEGGQADRCADVAAYRSWIDPIVRGEAGGEVPDGMGSCDGVSVSLGQGAFRIPR
jgi:hypothetical protein